MRKQEGHQNETPESRHFAEAGGQSPEAWIRRREVCGSFMSCNVAMVCGRVPMRHNGRKPAQGPSSEAGSVWGTRDINATCFHPSDRSLVQWISKCAFTWQGANTGESKGVFGTI